MSKPTVADFTASVTRTITAFVADPSERYRNLDSGRITTAGLVSFDCGHSYRWHPHGLRDQDPMPAAGQQAMCAECIQAALKANQDETGA